MFVKLDTYTNQKQNVHQIHLFACIVHESLSQDLS